mmetsp:Transcript_100380/g.178406  ORF Transcript_100380/g.178406 Transcript_100380/m.178406 type:complete len:218 (+) Transcript_100380:85-738(+)|eukprot:CAMPEP_0197662920 /NCGR_PEP_ID=MMETSP1338-20131121/55380_1 /TAXON_ID=43686 ORGANISM="Pelagodinium beii, Strain RCC1491" /NCGR_SAMPLE_ID=MMETSP1338 /ASSEMBLY_ACC=CAM_ASM_000754 /LENGTH=217 /DNA_ID=CAMNT_0043241027 /DNA_START=78 /DNA_END=731 /DNA_ORIENTATION=+
MKKFLWLPLLFALLEGRDAKGHGRLAKIQADGQVQLEVEDEDLHGGRKETKTDDCGGRVNVVSCKTRQTPERCQLAMANNGYFNFGCEWKDDKGHCGWGPLCQATCEFTNLTNHTCNGHREEQECNRMRMFTGIGYSSCSWDVHHEKCFVNNNCQNLTAPSHRRRILPESFLKRMAQPPEDIDPEEEERNAEHVNDAQRNNAKALHLHDKRVNDPES